MNTFGKIGVASTVLLVCGLAAFPRGTASAFDSPLATAITVPDECYYWPNGDDWIRICPLPRPTVVSPLATPLGVDCLTCIEIAAAGYEIDCAERCSATIVEPVGNETDTSPLPTPGPTVISPLPIPDQPGADCGIDLITEIGEACASVDDVV